MGGKVRGQDKGELVGIPSGDPAAVRIRKELACPGEAWGVFVSLGWAPPVEGPVTPQEVGSGHPVVQQRSHPAPRLRCLSQSLIPHQWFGAREFHFLSLDPAPCSPEALLPHSLSSGV